MTNFGSNTVLISTEPIATLHIVSILVSDHRAILIIIMLDMSTASNLNNKPVTLLFLSLTLMFKSLTKVKRLIKLAYIH